MVVLMVCVDAFDFNCTSRAFYEFHCWEHIVLRLGSD